MERRWLEYPFSPVLLYSLLQQAFSFPLIFDSFSSFFHSIYLWVCQFFFFVPLILLTTARFQCTDCYWLYFFFFLLFLSSPGFLYTYLLLADVFVVVVDRCCIARRHSSSYHLIPIWYHILVLFLLCIVRYCIITPCISHSST